MQPSDQLDDDLNFLLGKATSVKADYSPAISNGSSEQIGVKEEQVQQKQQKPKRKPKKKIVSIDEIKGDMDEIVFSSDEESAVKPTTAIKPRKKGKKPTKVGSEARVKASNDAQTKAGNDAQTKAVNDSGQEKKKRTSKKKAKQGDVIAKDEVNAKNAQEALDILKAELGTENSSKPSKKSKSSPEVKKAVKDSGPEVSEGSDKPKKRVQKKKSKAKLLDSNTSTHEENKPAAEEPAEVPGTTEVEQKPKKKLKNKKSKAKLLQQGEQAKESSEEGEKSSPKPEFELESCEKQPMSSRETTPEGMPFIKLKSVKSTHSNKKYSERLPKIAPIETIFGLSNEQVYKLTRNDIKIKQIVTQADKSLKNIINFVMNNEPVFENETTKDVFVTLCINVALYESKGLTKTLAKYPNVIELFGEYDELTLSYNNTVFTKSERKIHDNDFDYTVLSNIGNIIIWLSFVQNLDYVPKKEVKDCFGGFHLWDQLFKEKTINMKRWKHIIKFRELFPFQQNQFIVIMKFMHVGI